MTTRIFDLPNEILLQISTYFPTPTYIVHHQRYSHDHGWHESSNLIPRIPLGYPFAYKFAYRWNYIFLYQPASDREISVFNSITTSNGAKLALKQLEHRFSDSRYDERWKEITKLQMRKTTEWGPRHVAAQVATGSKKGVTEPYDQRKTEQVQKRTVPVESNTTTYTSEQTKILWNEKMPERMIVVPEPYTFGRRGLDWWTFIFFGKAGERDREAELEKEVHALYSAPTMLPSI